MVTLVCDKCEKAFAVDPAVVGPKAACPYCGDIKTVADAAAAAVAPPDGLGGPTPGSAPVGRVAGLPPRDGPEVRVVLSRPALLRSAPFQVLALLAGGVGGVIAAAWLAFGRAGAGGNASANAVLAWVFLAAGLGCLGVLGAWKVWISADRLEITTRRVRLTKGLLSRSSVEMLHRSVQDIEIDQSVWQRILGTGTIRIANAGEEEDEIEIKDVPRPHRIRDVIDAYR